MLGKTNREIGRELLISESTVKANMTSIFSKLGVSNRTGAAVLGSELFPSLGTVASQRPTEAGSR